ncbi:MAG: sugar ABC transporter ATP-binding protein [Polyangiaceae bacterium]|nr:sugar ABC transporter ATP-binding protein [Polyangiaceae bacterium]
MTRQSANALATLSGVSVTFGATRALADVSFEVLPGCVHILAGENGAGKSTLIRVLSGVVREYTGELRLAGKPVRFQSARDASAHGVATIYQELSLIGSLSVADNLALCTHGGFLSKIDRRSELEEAKKLLQEMALDIDPLAPVETLPLADRQLLEIGRALQKKATIFIFDEPTSALSEPEAERLMVRINGLKKRGCGIVYISHRMEENDRIGDHVTVLCDGKVTLDKPKKVTDRAEIVDAMMGAGSRRALSPAGAPQPSLQNGPVQTALESADERSARNVALQVRGLSLNVPSVPKLCDVSLEVFAGEIVGIAGLRGSGTAELPAALFGAWGAEARVESAAIEGRPFSIVSPTDSIKAGIVYLAADRQKTVFYDLDIAQNISLSSLESVSKWGVLRSTDEYTLAQKMTSLLRVAAPSMRSWAGSLSGGNQQKTALLRVVTTRPKLLLLDEPARGVDLMAKADIFETLRKVAAQGTAVVVVLSELKDMIDLCDRVMVMSRGRIVRTLEKKDFSLGELRLALDDPEAAEHRETGEQAP